MLVRAITDGGGVGGGGEPLVTLRQDLRRSSRLTTVRDVRLTLCDAAPFDPQLPAVIHDLSDGGIGLACAAPMLPGQKFLVAMSLDDAERSAGCLCRVVWMRELTHGWWSIGAARLEDTCSRCTKRCSARAPRLKRVRWPESA